jgi:hypothetical protein
MRTNFTPPQNKVARASSLTSLGTLIAHAIRTSNRCDAAGSGPLAPLGRGP